MSRRQIIDKAPRAFRDASDVYHVAPGDHPDWASGNLIFRSNEVSNNLNRNKVTQRVTVKDSAEEAASKAEAVAVLKQLLPVLEGLLAKQQAGKGAQSDAEHPENLVAPAARRGAQAAADAGFRAGVVAARDSHDSLQAADADMLAQMGGELGQNQRKIWNSLAQRWVFVE